ncbi:hypothetical protein [Lonsdalea quercina]|uniref:hypothetical protein n=1 Tax=Lonsdalea quercina TaxID=71657 RepID=UPI003975E950
MFAQLIRTQKYSAASLPDGYQKPYYPLIVMNDDYSVVDDDVQLNIYTDRGDINLILDFESSIVSDEYSGTSIDVTLKPDNLVLINAQPMIHVDTDVDITFTLYVDITYKGETQSLSQQVQTLSRLDIIKRIGAVDLIPRYHLQYSYGAGNKQTLMYSSEGESWGENVNIILSVDNDAVLKDSVGNAVSQITLSGGSEPYEYIFECEPTKKGVSVLSVRLDGDVPDDEKDVIYRVPWFFIVL